MKNTNTSFLKLQPLEDVIPAPIKVHSAVTSPLTRFLSPVSSPKNRDMFIGLSPKVSLNMSMNFPSRDSPDSSPVFSTQSMSPDFVRGPRKKIFTLVKPRKQRVILNSVSFAHTLTEDNNEDCDTNRYRNRLFTPVQEERVISGDDDQQKINGEQGSGKFYSDYHKLDKIADINNFNRVQNAPHTSFLKKSEDLCLLPSKLGFLNKDGSKEGLKINHYRLGDKYASILSEGLKTSANFNKFELSHNRLTGVGANILLSAMTNGTEMIDLSGNNIGKMGCEQLCQIIKQRNQKLREINLEGNKLGDYAISELCEAIAINTSIKKLNLNKNSISNKAAESIGKMLDQNSSLEELYLSWNQIRGEGGAAIFEGLKTNTDLRVLDLSWNSIGLNYTPFIAAFHEVITKNKILIHLDLSNNCFKKDAAREIAKSLEANQTLYGFHFQGNVGYVDAKGFLVVSDNAAEEISSQAVAPRIQGVNPQPESLKRYHQNTNEFKDACWICEGWRPIEVKWVPGVSGDGDQDPVYVHFSYEGHRGRFLPKNKGYRTVRMAPPVEFKYLFTVDNFHLHAEGQPACQNMSGGMKLLFNDKPKLIRPEFTNCLESVSPQNILTEEFKPVANIEKLGIKPRMPDEIYIPPEIRVERPIWKFPISIFREYRPDTQALLDKCFEVDFEGTRIAKIVKNEEDIKNVRDLLYSVYKNLKDCYRYFAAVGAPGEIWSIPLNAYTDFASNTNMIDGKILRLADFDRIFIATYTRTDKERNPRNPDRALVRYQFMEGLVRLADYKFINSGLATTFHDALKMLMDDHIKPYISKFDHQKWRSERYWNEDVDTVLKSYCPIFKGAYKKFSGLKTLPGQKKFMSLEEFYNLVNEMSMFNENCGEREVPVAYNLAMMTQIDELETDRIFQMQFVEFLEAFSRMADKYSAAPIGKTEAEMSYEERAAQPLHIKIEGLVQRMFNACGADTREVWILPETSVYELEEVTGRQRYNTKKKKIVRINPTHPDSADAYDV